MNRIDNKNIAIKISKLSTAVYIITLCLLLSTVMSATGGDYDLTWSTIDGGGGRSSGGLYTLTGTIGQPDAAYSSGGNYELLGGFWTGGPLCFVDFDHFTRFAEHWLDVSCDAANNWCGGADLNQLDGVNRVDLRLFVEEWLCYCPTGWPVK